MMRGVRTDDELTITTTTLTREFISSLAKVLRSAGWELDPNKLRAFRHPVTGEIIEIEPGGEETSGHFLHFVKSD